MKKNLKELKATLASKKQAGKAKLTEFDALSAKGEPSEADTAKMAALDADISALEAEVETLTAEISTEETRIRRQSAFTASTALDTNRARVEVLRDAPNPATTNGFNSMAEFARAVRLASTNMSYDDRLNAAAPSNIHQSGGNAGEGYLVPAEYRQQIWDVVFSGYDLLPLFAPSPTSSNLVHFIKDETTPWGAAGVQAVWRTEAAVMSASKLSLQGASVPLHELIAFVGATEELLQDAPQLQNRLTMKAGQALRFRASRAIYEGTGAGQPQGFMNGPGLVTQAAEGGQTAGTINVQNLAKMVTRLLPSSLGSAYWLASPEILPQLVGLTIGNIPVFTSPQQGMTEGVAGFILGRPVIYTEHNAPLGSVGDIVLADPAGYMALTKEGGGIDFASSIHLWFDQAATAFRWIFRVGGQPMLSAPQSPNKGSLTKSHFVTLAAR
jgi:HK97 family phage major capsid protein